MSEGAGAADLAKGIAGQRVLITAGAGGIGLAIAQRLARHGARVFVCDVDEKALDAFGSAYPKAGRIKADVSDDADVDRLFEAVVGDARRARRARSTMPASPGRPAASTRSIRPTGGAASKSA